MLTIHPHGVFNLGLVWNYDVNFNVKILASRMIMMAPILGMFLKIFDVESVDP